MGAQTPATPAAGGGNRKVDLRSPEPPPESHLSPRERKVWDYICAVLADEGLPHRTAGIAITIICKTFIQYIQAERELQEYIASNKGSILQVSKKSDYSQPHPLYYAARDIKQELLKWLPEACLSLPSAVMAKAKMGEEGQQDDLFGDLLAHAQRERSAGKKRAEQESTSPA
ncbi:P27 family phage terminase small subunit [Cupriavidus plantarum]|uniref:P27 family phage terminase small subunit n=1 Tax=Cupriavidus plantarum TaxID=942865 RepID=UPI000EABC6B6|nr:P27 family phage terminase small subunit [Cupriavidus plantarum]RLK45957.1 phage terminase small subunit [Cupriavidus plantarum]